MFAAAQWYKSCLTQPCFLRTLLRWAQTLCTSYCLHPIFNWCWWAFCSSSFKQRSFSHHPDWNTKHRKGGLSKRSPEACSAMWGDKLLGRDTWSRNLRLAAHTLGWPLLAGWCCSLTGAPQSLAFFLFIARWEGKQGSLKLVGVSALSTLDFRTASQTTPRDSCNDGNNNFFPELRSEYSIQHKVLRDCFEYG